MNPIKGSVLAVVLFLVFVIWQIPASQALRFVELPKNTRVGVVQGTLWEGNSAFVETPDLTVNNVAWQLSPWKLLLGQLSVDLKLGEGVDVPGIKGSAQVTRSLFGWSADNVQLSAPPSLVMNKVPLPIPVDVEGQFSLVIDFVSQGEPLCDSLQGRINWRQAAVIGPDGEIPLGSFNGGLTCAEGKVQLSLAENPVGVVLSAEMGAANDYSISGYLSPKANTPEQLVQAAQLMATADNQGRFRFDIKS